ncbi:M1 family metallopeptidase [Colwellia piezophila]|uniref:M1 family metallopeptidase n=1 Tax=Colwellia piezophila TaxID=211668 RepID=UPI00037E6100|nr:M1 family metallopeptidase [Colwellia piezophila]
MFNYKKIKKSSLGICLIFMQVILSPLALAETEEHRLPSATVPTAQSIEMHLDPTKDGYSGITTIDINVTKATKRIGIHWLDLTVKSITLKNNNSERVLTASKGKYDIQWLSDGKDIASGSYQLVLEYAGKFSKDALGLYRTKYQGRHYIFTQFQMLFARRAFPIFDEPNVKIPYQLTLTVPKNLKVATNTPVFKEISQGDNKTVHFQATPPMPSYLIAITVGDLDKTPIKGLSVPGFIYSPKGTGNQTGFTIKHTPKILAALEDYFGMKYPYKKLDFIAVPDYAFGAMENPGLVTYRTELLLRGDTASARDAESSLNVIAHELAHMWYGDLVTMKWWNDLWLNEAFATWMAQKIMAQHYPQYQSNLSLPQEDAFYEDALSTTKAIRKEIITADDAEDGMGLNYSKGHAILNMLEQTIGEDDFQIAIQNYMQKHQWKNTTAQDLWNALEKQSNYQISEIANTFLNQPGFALISFNDKGQVTQQRFKNYGSKVPEQTWQVPLTIKYKQNNKIAFKQVLLTDKPLQIQSLIEADWYFPVANGNGYFRWEIPQDKYKALVNDVSALSNPEKVALLSNSSGLLNAGKISVADHLTLLTQLSHEDNAIVFLKVIEEIKVIGEQHINAANQYAFSDYITEILTPWYKRIGSKTRAGDDDAILALRPRLLRTLGQLGNNPKLNKELITLAHKYLKGDESIDDNLGREALRIAAMLDNGDLVKTYFDTYLASSDASLKSNIMSSMYFTKEKSVQYLLEQILNEDIPAGDKASPLSGTFYINKDQSHIYQWLDKNFDQMVKALPQIYQGYLPFIMSPSCQADNVEKMKSFYHAKGEVYQASLSKSLEAENNCLVMKKREAQSFSQFLARYQNGINSQSL